MLHHRFSSYTPCSSWTRSQSANTFELLRHTKRRTLPLKVIAPSNRERVESWVEIFVFRNGQDEPNVATPNRASACLDSLRITADSPLSRWSSAPCSPSD